MTDHRKEIIKAVQEARDHREDMRRRTRARRAAANLRVLLSPDAAYWLVTHLRDLPPTPREEVGCWCHQMPKGMQCGPCVATALNEGAGS